MLKRRVLLLLLSLLLFSLIVNQGFLLLSSELLVMLSSLLFVTLSVAALRKAARLHSFQRAYQVLLVFLFLQRISAWLLLQLRCSLVIFSHWLRMLALSIPLRNAALSLISLLVLAKRIPGRAVTPTHLLGVTRGKPLPLVLSFKNNQKCHG